jgi:hypothetical protein
LMLGIKSFFISDLLILEKNLLDFEYKCLFILRGCFK